MPPMSDKDFYVGYQKKAPVALARWIRRVVVGILAFAGVLALTFALVQRPFGPGIFEFGIERQFSGTIRSHPYPALEVERPQASSDPLIPARSRYSLVAFGKHGAAAQVKDFDGRAVELSGSLIYREGHTMIELIEGSIHPLESGAPSLPDATEEIDLGVHTLRGEIVDSKCYLGVMKPGREKPHRACAALCIRGGVPPIFLVESVGGERAFFFLSDEQGGAVNTRILDLVAEPIEITGRILRRGEFLTMVADPASYRRLTG